MTRMMCPAAICLTGLAVWVAGCGVGSSPSAHYRLLDDG